MPGTPGTRSEDSDGAGDAEGGFDVAYAQGMPVSLLDQVSRSPRGFGAADDTDEGQRLVAPPAAVEPLAGADLDGSIALGGTIITPDGPVRGWITVQDGQIAKIAKRKP